MGLTTAGSQPSLARALTAERFSLIDRARDYRARPLLLTDAEREAWRQELVDREWMNFCHSARVAEVMSPLPVGVFERERP